MKTYAAQHVILEDLEVPATIHTVDCGWYWLKSTREMRRIGQDVNKSTLLHIDRGSGEINENDCRDGNRESTIPGQYCTSIPPRERIMERPILERA